MGRAGIHGRMAAARNKGIWLVFAAVLATPMPTVSMAQSQSPATCVPIDQALERLACYDALFNPDAVAPMTNEAWRIEMATSPISGRTNVRLTAVSDKPVPADYGDPLPATLELRCEENVTSAMFSFGGNYMSQSGDYGTIKYRLGNASASTLRASVSADNTRIGLSSGASAIPFVRQLLTVSVLLVEANPVNRDGRPVSARFNIGGLGKSIAPLRQSCGW